MLRSEIYERSPMRVLTPLQGGLKEERAWGGAGQCGLGQKRSARSHRAGPYSSRSKGAACVHARERGACAKLLRRDFSGCGSSSLALRPKTGLPFRSREIV